MSLFSIFSKPNKNVVEMALLKQDAVLALWKIQTDASYTFERSMLAGCIDNDLFQQWVQEVNRSRIDLQDNFLLVMKTSRIREQIQRAKDGLAEMVKQKVTIVRKKERAMYPVERAGHLVENFEAQFRQARQENLISRRIEVELVSQNKMYFTALKESLDNTELRDNIKLNLAHELIDDYYSNVYRIFSETKARRKRL